MILKILFNIMHKIINCLLKYKNNKNNKNNKHNNYLNKQDTEFIDDDDRYNDDDYDDDYDDDNYLIQNDLLCIICLTELSSKSIKILKCNHKYHDECLKEWFTFKKICPTCSSVQKLQKKI